MIFIVGICGTFMAGIACIARDLGLPVTGCDSNVYPPMSDVLSARGISIINGYEKLPPSQTPPLFIIGNAAKRGMPLVEQIISNKWPYVSGPQWLYENVLRNKQVIAFAGTHGKTTTSSLMAWVLEYNDLNPSFLIGGAAKNFNSSARVTNSKYFVIEADEYDTAFFDKRSKLVHYRPELAVINNLEFDHADIFDSLADIQKQIHGMIRTMPTQGTVIYPNEEQAIDDVIAMGCWSNVIKTNNPIGLNARLLSDDGQSFEIWNSDSKLIQVEWQLLGHHNIANALSVFAASQVTGISAEKIAASFAAFEGVQRRLEIKTKINGYTVYDDFAHHPTAIKTTIAALKKNLSNQPIAVVLTFGSFTMHVGYMFKEVIQALEKADFVFLLSAPKSASSMKLPSNYITPSSIDELSEKMSAQLCNVKHILVMGNKAHEQLHVQLEQLCKKIY